MSSPVDEYAHLPSCQRCRAKKIKCDRKPPKCSPCARSLAECLLIDFKTKAQFTREHIAQLEDRVIQSGQQPFPTKSTNQPSSGEVVVDDETSPTVDKVSGRPRRASSFRYVGEGSGFGFLKELFADEDWRNNNAELLQKLSQRPDINREVNHPNPLPSFQEADVLVEAFLAGAHVQSPVIFHHEIRAILRSVYSNLGNLSSIPQTHLCRLFLVLAIGAVPLFRNKRHAAHPVGYYLSAMQYFPREFLAQGIEAIQNLLLIARFAIFYHIGASIWDISQICIRMCVENELHLKPQNPLPADSEQLQRQVFWQSYTIDRNSCITLGRPFAISDADISVELPADVKDEDLVAGGMSLDEIGLISSLSKVPTKMSAFIALIQLRQIGSRIYSRFSHEHSSNHDLRMDSSLESSGRVYVALNSFLVDLKKWRSQVARHENPTSVYEREEYNDFLYQRERLLLTRQAIDHLPRQIGMPPRDLFSICQQSAVQVIVIYYDLFQQGRIAYTRSYFHTLFTAGLSIMCCAEAKKSPNTPASSPTAESRTSAVNAVAYCQELLTTIGGQLQDVDVYVAVFAALRQKFLKDLGVRVRGDGTASQSLVTDSNRLSALPAHNGETDHQNFHLDSADMMTAPNPQNAQYNRLFENIPINTTISNAPDTEFPSTNIGNTIVFDEYQLLVQQEPMFWGDSSVWNMDMDAGLNGYLHGGINVNNFLGSSWSGLNVTGKDGTT